MQNRIQRIGKNLQMARKRRKKTVKQAAEMMGTSLSSVRRMEDGDPAVRFETYLAALEVYQLEDTLRFAEPEEDLIGLALEKQRLPQRVRVKKEKRLDF
ncbi:MAG: helix-turn-helix domain-containing protein [Proteobacteria bacterium]|nr:helix-turn-helix domain-containing protein [Pseudomonadota bacterium]MBU4296217.1 helix-turn-helix domain-containing protein [Pseudomonadota bacterium]MCG2746425.1 helix-turn-helix domain-containing protein [Desulfobulbaceae bacterium]